MGPWLVGDDVVAGTAATGFQMTDNCLRQGAGYPKIKNPDGHALVEEISQPAVGFG
jgi:hypothetical protein